MPSYKLLSILTLRFIYCFYCVFVCTCHWAHVEEGILWKSFLSFHHVESQDCTQTREHGGSFLYTGSLLAGPLKLKKKKKHSYNSILHFPNYFLRVNPCKWIKGMLIFKVSVLARTFKFHFTNGESTMQWLTEMDPLSPLWLIHHLQVTRWKTFAIIPAVTCSPLCGEIWAPATTSLFLWLV